jgi:hypothetical protein
VGCFWDYGVGHHPLKTLNGRLSIILGSPKGTSPLKHFRRLEVVTLNLQGPNPERGLASGQLRLSQLKSFRPILGVGPRRPLNQHGVDLTNGDVVRL